MPQFTLPRNEKDAELMKKNLARVGAASDLPYEARVQALQQVVAELLTALQKAGHKTDL